MGVNRFFPLQICDVRRETPTAVSIALDVPARWSRMYRFVPGQYLTLRAVVNRRELRRPYSICSGTNEPTLRIAIKRIEGGRFSNFANDALKVGQSIDVMPPHGNFTPTLPATASARYLLCATGSGITPILSILKAILVEEPRSRVLLCYGNRSGGEILFHGELEVQAGRYPGRLKIVHFLSRESAAPPQLQGHVDARISDLARECLGPIAELEACFMCGVSGMIEAVREVLERGGLVSGRIHAELFNGAAGPVPDGAALDATAELIVGGTRQEVRLGSTTVLEAALEAGLDLAYSCRIGSCSTCVARVLEGTVKMAVNNALDPKHVAQGYVLTCQAWAMTPRIVIDCDANEIES